MRRGNTTAALTRDSNSLNSIIKGRSTTRGLRPSHVNLSTHSQVSRTYSEKTSRVLNDYDETILRSLVKPVFDAQMRRQRLSKGHADPQSLARGWFGEWYVLANQIIDLEVRGDGPEASPFLCLKHRETRTRWAITMNNKQGETPGKVVTHL